MSSTRNISRAYGAAAKALKDGMLVVMPSDTIYGIFASALDVSAVESVYEKRGRNQHKPCIVLLSCPEELGDFGVNVGDEDFSRAKKLWRSRRPTSIVMPVPSTDRRRLRYLHRGQGSIAFRVPSGRSLRGRRLLKLLKKTGPLIAPSANPEGQQPAQTVQEARAYFRTDVAVYISAGRRLKQKPSRICFSDNDGIRCVR